MSPGRGLSPGRAMPSQWLPGVFGASVHLDDPPATLLLERAEKPSSPTGGPAAWRVMDGQMYLYVIFTPSPWPLSTFMCQVSWDVALLNPGLMLWPKGAMGLCLTRCNSCVSISAWACIGVCACTYVHIKSCVSLAFGLGVNADRQQSPGLRWLLLAISGQRKGRYPARWSKLHFLSSAIAFPIPSPSCS